MRHNITLQAPFDRLLLCDINPHIALRKAIVLQAVIDATSQALDRKAVKFKQEARDWVLGNDSDFQEICFEGDMNPHEIIRIMREMINMADEDAVRADIIRNKRVEPSNNALDACTKYRKTSSGQRNINIDRIKN